MAVTDLGEFELIERLVESVERARRERSASWGPQVRVASGDDAAVTVPGGATATSVDAMVEGVHFERRTDLAAVIGGAQGDRDALSDLAAMGAAPGEAYVQLGVPDDLDEAGLRRARRRVGGVGRGALRGGSRRRRHAGPGAHPGDHRRRPRRHSRRAGAEIRRPRGRRCSRSPGSWAARPPGCCSSSARSSRRASPDGVAERLRERQLEPEPGSRPGGRWPRAGATRDDRRQRRPRRRRRPPGRRPAGSRLVVELERLPVQEGVEQVAAAAGIDARRPGRGSRRGLRAAGDRARRAARAGPAGGRGRHRVDADRGGP